MNHLLSTVEPEPYVPFINIHVRLPNNSPQVSFCLTNVSVFWGLAPIINNDSSMNGYLPLYWPLALQDSGISSISQHFLVVSIA